MDFPTIAIVFVAFSVLVGISYSIYNAINLDTN